MRLAAGLARLGTESAFELLARAEVLKAQGQDIINLGIGQPDFRTPDHIVTAAQKALGDENDDRVRANPNSAFRDSGFPCITPR